MQAFISLPGGHYGFPSYPDLDMLPLGYLGIEGQNIAPTRNCALTQDEQISLLSLWMIFKSPLMYGGDLRHPDPFSLGLLANPEALTINGNSTNNRYLVSNATFALWVADSGSRATDGISYVSIHNLADTALNTMFTTSQLRPSSSSSGTNDEAAADPVCQLRDIWARTDLSKDSSFSFSLRPHQSGLYSLSQCKSMNNKRSVNNRLVTKIQ